ncbi:MAG: alpha/beta fold hydrolase [Phascolarctobacterium faecium]
MNIDQKYFPEFKQQLIDVGDGIKINTLVGGKGSEAILLLHGHPETHLIWRFLTPGLTGLYTVVITDLRIWRQQQAQDFGSCHYSSGLAETISLIMSKLGFENSWCRS